MENKHKLERKHPFNQVKKIFIEYLRCLEKANALVAPVRNPLDLYCGDFDEKCRWRNMEGLLVDELDWFQGAGFLDDARLRIATGTHLKPGMFF